MKKSLSSYMLMSIASLLLAACGGGGGSSSTTSSSGTLSATNCRTTAVSLSGGLPPGMTTMAALGTNYITSVTAGASNVVVLSKDVPQSLLALLPDF